MKSWAKLAVFALTTVSVAAVAYIAGREAERVEQYEREQKIVLPLVDPSDGIVAPSPVRTSAPKQVVVDVESAVDLV